MEWSHQQDHTVSQFHPWLSLKKHQGSISAHKNHGIQHSCQTKTRIFLYCLGSYTATNISKIEAVQCQAACWVTGRYHNTSSVSDMLSQLGWPTLQRRQQTILLMMYKVVNKLISIDHSFLQHPAHTTRPAHSYSFIPMYTHTDSFKYSFFQRTII